MLNEAISLISAMFKLIEVTQAMLVIFPDVSRTSKEPILYRADRTHRSQKHQQDNDSKVETHAQKGRSKGTEAVAAPSDKSSLYSSGDEATPSRSHTDKTTPSRSHTDVSTTNSRSSTDVSTTLGSSEANAAITPGSSSMDAATTTPSSSSTDESSTPGSSSTDESSTPGSSSTDERRPCSQLQLLLASASSTPLISKDLNDACRPEITDIAVVFNGVQPDDGPSAATGHHAHVDLLPMATARCQAHGPTCSSVKSRLTEVTQPLQ